MNRQNIGIKAIKLLKALAINMLSYFVLIAAIVGIIDTIRDKNKFEEHSSKCTCEVEGTICDVTLQESGFYDDDTGEPEYMYKIDFNYTVNNTVYAGGTTSYNDEYSIGDGINIYYNPDEPSQSMTADKKTKTSFVGYYIFYTFVAIVGLVISRLIKRWFSVEKS